jgi:hypothetical protein
LINQSGGLTFGKEREALLERALEQLAGGEDPEARAIALAMLAQQDPAGLPAAIEEGERAIAVGAEPNWIRAHLAEAAILAGDDEPALRFTSEIEPEFFLANDLHWRVVRFNEIRAIALLRLGRTDEALDAVDSVLADVVRGDDDGDDFPPPSQLVRAALTLGARPVLERVARSLDLEQWFPPSVVAEIRAALK